MPPETQTRATQDDRFDIHAAAARWNASRRQAAEQLLNVWEKTVGRLADAHVRTARAADNPMLITIAETQANLSRDVTDAYTASVRKLLEL